jgi:hypothetical protein
MATSRSDKKPGGWIGGLLFFSGRPDPTWDVDEKAARRLVRIWESMETRSGEPPAAPALGFRGCFLRDVATREWLAYGGVVVLKAAGKTESREDKDRRFEKLLLATAPKGTIPRAVLEQK